MEKKNNIEDSQAGNSENREKISAKQVTIVVEAKKISSDDDRETDQKNPSHVELISIILPFQIVFLCLAVELFCSIS